MTVSVRNGSERIVIPQGLVIIKYIANLPLCIFCTFFLKVLLT